MNCEQWRNRLGPLLPGIVLVMCLVQPVLDVLSFWQDRLGIGNTATLLLRFGLLFGMVGLGFVLSRRKRHYVALAAVLGIFTLCHGVICWRNGYIGLVSDMTNLVRIYQLPLITLAFITFLTENRNCMDSIRLGFTVNVVVILAVEVLSVATGTNPWTYPNKEVGILGWFYFANAQSAILSMVVPVGLAYVMEKKAYHPGWTLGAALVSFGLLYFFATRLSYAALLGTACVFCVGLLLLKKMKGTSTVRSAAVMALCVVLAVGLVSFSPMYRNNELVGINQILKQEDINSLVAEDDAAAAEAGLQGEERVLASLQSAYEKYLPGPTGRFGLERTAGVYGYSTDVSALSDDRLQKNTYCRMLLEDQPSSRIFGLELSDMLFDGKNYDVENDFHGIYFLCGGVGLVLMVAFLGYFLWQIAWALLRDVKHYFTVENMGVGIALICGLAHAYFTAGVLRRPNTTFYLAVILAAVYALTRKGLPGKEESNET